MKERVRSVLECEGEKENNGLFGSLKKEGEGFGGVSTTFNPL